MPSPIDRNADVWEGSRVTFLDRLVNSAGTVLTEDDVTSFDLRVWNSGERRSGKKIEEAASPSGIVFDTLATTHGWTRDTTGWNVKYELDYDDFKALGEKRYKFEFVYHTEDYGDIPIVWNIRVRGLDSV